jgi:hypothetical protein
MTSDASDLSRRLVRPAACHRTPSGVLGTLKQRACWIARRRRGTARSGLTAGEVIALAVGLAWAAQQPGAPADSMVLLLSTAMHGLAVPV